MNPWVRKEAHKNKDVLVSRRDVALSRDKLHYIFVFNKYQLFNFYFTNNSRPINQGNIYCEA